MVITRYLYKPTAGEGMTHFNDNKRLHLFTVDLVSKKVQQLTEGNFDEHSVNWSPNGEEILFASNRAPNPDEFFHYDLFALRVSETDSSDYGKRKLQVRTPVVARREADYISRHETRINRPGNDDGGHVRLGHECRWQSAARDRRVNR